MKEVKPQPEKALSPIRVTVAGYSTDDREEQPWKQPFGILVMFALIETLVRDVQPKYLLLVDYQYYTL